LPLKILDINTDKARDLYGADLALVRPDQIVANCFFRCGQCGRPSRAVHSTAIRCDLIDGYVSAEGSARDYGIADAQMLRNAAAREQEN
jgi:hypothetical protein